MPDLRSTAQGLPDDAGNQSHRHEVRRDDSRRDDSRRGFIRGSSLLLAGALPAAGVASVAEVASQAGKFAGSSELKVGLIGCGYRGIAAASELLAATAATCPLQLTALADAFPDRLQQAVRTLRGRFGDRVHAAASSRYVGLRAFEGVLASDVDVVLLATPPVFRPAHFEAAIAAQKHVYAETPIAVDMPGIDRFQTALASAQAQSLAVAVGLLPRHRPRYQLSISQLRRGMIGQILSVQALHPSIARKTAAGPRSQTDFQVQLRQWSRHAWASGGELVEQRVRGLDVVNWLLDSHPLEARGGTCSGAPADQQDDVLEFLYPGAVKLRCATAIGNSGSGKDALITVQGSQGWCDLTAGKIFNACNELIWRADDALVEADGQPVDAAQAADGEERSAAFKRIASRADCGELWNNFLIAVVDGPKHFRGASLGGAVANAAIDSTRTAILGRMAAQTQRPISWDDCLNRSEVFAGNGSSNSTLALTAID